MRVANKIMQGGERVKLHGENIVCGDMDNVKLLEDWLKQDEPIRLPLENGWTGTLEISKNGLNQVHLRGYIASPSTVDRRQAVCELPDVFIPHRSVLITAFSSTNGNLIFFGALGGGHGRLEIWPDYGTTIQVKPNYSFYINVLYQV